jgi:hypothetical protein
LRCDSLQQHNLRCFVCTIEAEDHKSEALTPYLNELITPSAAPLKSIESDFAVDSSGFSTGQFMRWLDVKDGTKEDIPSRRRSLSNSNRRSLDRKT